MPSGRTCEGSQMNGPEGSCETVLKPTGTHPNLPRTRSRTKANGTHSCGAPAPPVPSLGGSTAYMQTHTHKHTHTLPRHATGGADSLLTVTSPPGPARVA